MGDVRSQRDSLQRAAWEALLKTPFMSLFVRRANKWKSRWKAVRDHHGTTWWNRRPLVWVWVGIGCAVLVLVVFAPNMRFWVRSTYVPPEVVILVLVAFTLITAPGLLGLLVAIFTPSRGALWLGRHFTLGVIVYMAIQLGLQGIGLWLLQ